MILTRDSHYIEESERPLHEALKQLVAFSDDPDDAIFSGDGYHMTDAAGLRPYFPPKILAAGLDGLAELAEAGLRPAAGAGDLHAQGARRLDWAGTRRPSSRTSSRT